MQSNRDRLFAVSIIKYGMCSNVCRNAPPEVLERISRLSQSSRERREEMERAAAEEPSDQVGKEVKRLLMTMLSELEAWAVVEKARHG